MKLDEKAIHDLAMQYTKLQIEENLKEQPELMHDYKGMLDNMTASYAHAVDYLSSMSEEFINALIGK